MRIGTSGIRQKLNEAEGGRTERYNNKNEVIIQKILRTI